MKRIMQYFAPPIFADDEDLKQFSEPLQSGDAMIPYFLMVGTLSVIKRLMKLTKKS